MKYLGLGCLLALVAVVASINVGCAPQFNASRKVAAITPERPRTTSTTRTLTQVIDPNAAGGGASGTSASYRISAVNISHITKTPSGASTNYRLKPGAHGQLAP